jgi:hypothetical protein
LAGVGCSHCMSVTDVEWVLGARPPNVPPELASRTGR